MSAYTKVDQLFNLLQSKGNADYIGESISQIEHAVQAAQCAERVNAPDEVVIAALFHDIGHLLDEGDDMGGLGKVDHEGLGANYMLSLGFSNTVAELIKGHVKGKRYLTYKYPSYYEKLSEASKGTLAYQGGPMTADEAAAFEADPLFDWHLKIRAWDEQAKEVGLPLPDMQHYKDICIKLLTN
jgi:2-amino-1-hydroxyethylphosphonate dioxygenase (glycine-forming)